MLVRFPRYQVLNSALHFGAFSDPGCHSSAGSTQRGDDVFCGLGRGCSVCFVFFGDALVLWFAGLAWLCCLVGWVCFVGLVVFVYFVVWCGFAVITCFVAVVLIWFDLLLLV